MATMDPMKYGNNESKIWQHNPVIKGTKRSSYATSIGSLWLEVIIFTLHGIWYAALLSELYQNY